MVKPSDLPKYSQIALLASFLDLQRGSRHCRSRFEMRSFDPPPLPLSMHGRPSSAFLVGVPFTQIVVLLLRAGSTKAESLASVRGSMYSRTLGVASNVRTSEE